MFDGMSQQTGNASKGKDVVQYGSLFQGSCDLEGRTFPKSKYAGRTRGTAARRRSGGLRNSYFVGARGAGAILRLGGSGGTQLQAPAVPRRLVQAWPELQSPAQSLTVDAILPGMVAGQSWRLACAPGPSLSPPCGLKLHYKDPTVVDGIWIAVSPNADLSANAKQWHTSLVDYVLDEKPPFHLFVMRLRLCGDPMGE